MCHFRPVSNLTPSVSKICIAGICQLIASFIILINLKAKCTSISNVNLLNQYYFNRIRICYKLN